MLDLYSLIDKLAQEHKLAQEQYEMLIEGHYIPPSIKFGSKP